MLIIRIILSAITAYFFLSWASRLLASDSWIVAFYVAQSGLYIVFLINALLVKNEETEQ